MGYRNKNGFTLIEILVVIAILGFLSAAIAMTFGMVTKVSTTAMGQNQALSEVHMAGSWISRDVQAARTGRDVKTTEELKTTDNKALCFMQCSVWDNSTKSFKPYTDNVTYRIDQGNLTRTSRPENGSASAKTITIAQFIEGPSETTTFFSSENITNKYFILKVKSNYNNSSFEKVYKIKKVVN